jgi:hypothetical protein
MAGRFSWITRIPFGIMDIERIAWSAQCHLERAFFSFNQCCPHAVMLRVVTEWYASGMRVVTAWYAKRQGSGKEAAKRWRMCGLRPRIKRHSCTFGRRLVPKKLTQFPRSYGRIMQPICKEIGFESELSPYFLANVHFLLYLCSVNH